MLYSVCWLCCICVICMYAQVSWICHLCFFFLMIRRPPRSTLDRSSAASDVYKRQKQWMPWIHLTDLVSIFEKAIENPDYSGTFNACTPVSYTHLRAHETVLDLVCRLLLEKKQHTDNHSVPTSQIIKTGTYHYNTEYNVCNKYPVFTYQE